MKSAALEAGRTMMRTLGPALLAGLVATAACADPARVPPPEPLALAGSLASGLDLPASLRFAALADTAREGAGQTRPEAGAAARGGWLSRTGEGALACLRQFWRTCPISDDPGPAKPRGRSVLVMVALTGTAAALFLAADPAVDPRWTGAGGFDTGARNALRGGTPSSRDASATASDALLAALGIGLIADWWWLRDDYPVANSALSDTSWWLSNLVTTEGIKLASARQRPLVRPCTLSSSYASGCSSTREYNQSFVSGHASNTAAFAGLICNRHLTRQGRDGWDVATCGAAAAGSLAVGLLRISADRHWTSDVLAGWAVGAVFGALLPYLVDYGGGGETEGSAGASLLRRSAIAPLGEPGAYGLRYTLQF